MPHAVRSLFEVVEVIPDGAAISARYLILVQGALCFALGGLGGFFELDSALSGNAYTFESDAGHRTAGRHLAAHFGGHKRWIMIAIAAIREAFGFHIGTGDARIVHGFLMIGKIGPAGVIGPCADTGAGFTAMTPAAS